MAPKKSDPIPTEVDWDTFALEALWLDPPVQVQAITAKGGLIRGATYYLTSVHRTGVVAVIGGKTSHPMDHFRRMRQLQGTKAEARSEPST